jgi:hypothetical protein
METMNSRIKVYHPCKGMTNSQIKAFEAIAVNAPACCSPTTIEALLKAGVIQRGPDIEKRDDLGRFTLPTYRVPTHIHMQWCEWCSKNINEGEGDHEF